MTKTTDTTKIKLSSSIQDAMIIKFNGKPEIVLQTLDQYEQQLELIAYYKYKQMIADGVT